MQAKSREAFGDKEQLRQLKGAGNRFLYKWLIIGIAAEIVAYFWIRSMGIASFTSSILLSLVFLVEAGVLIMTFFLLYKRFSYKTTMPFLLKSGGIILYLLFSLAGAFVTDQSKFILQAYLRMFALLTFYSLTIASLLLAIIWFNFENKSRRQQ